MAISLKGASFRNHKGLRLVKRLSANVDGRDFVVGDLHGCKKDLERLLQLVKFDRTVDRLISVGDLVDRGPQSLECLLLLKAPWFHAVMGNHEQLLLNYFRPWLESSGVPDPYGEAGLSLLINGGQWAMFESDGERRPTAPLNSLLPLVAALPQVLVVGAGAERYNVVHAELVKPGKTGEAANVWTDADIDGLEEFGMEEEDYPAFRWSRKFMANQRWSRRPPTVAQGLSTTYCGHTVGAGVRRAFSHICLDTGAFVAYREEGATENYGLTLAEVKEGRWMTVRELSLSEGEF